MESCFLFSKLHFCLRKTTEKLSKIVISVKNKIFIDFIDFAVRYSKINSTSVLKSSPNINARIQTRQKFYNKIDLFWANI